jgi:hypothetical protein
MKILSSEMFQAVSTRHLVKTVCEQDGALGSEISKLEKMASLGKE